MPFRPAHQYLPHPTLRTVEIDVRKENLLYQYITKSVFLFLFGVLKRKGFSVFILLGLYSSFVNAQCPVVQGSISSANYQLCSNQNGAIQIQVSPSTGGTFSGRFTNGRIFTGLAPVAGIISPTYTFVNAGSTSSTETFQLDTLSFTDTATNTTCRASLTSLTGNTTITILPLADIDAVLTTPTIVCSGNSVAITINNPNGLGGTYTQQIAYNGAGHVASVTANNQAYGVLNDVLTNSSMSAITVQYIFTPVRLGCSGIPDTVYATINPKPTIICPGNKTQNTDATTCTAVVSNIDPVASTNNTCNNITPVVSYILTGATSGSGAGSASGKAFNKGVTTVTYYITDGGNNKDSCRLNITIRDGQAPTFTACPSNITTASDSALCGAIVNYIATATDNCSGPVTLTYSIASGSVFPIGITPVMVVAKDSAGNTATCSFTVTVTNNTAIYVNDTSRSGDIYTTVVGNDATGNGTRCAPFATIQKAITTALTGTTIYVDAGTYREDVVIDKPLTLKGANYGNNPSGSGPFIKPSIIHPLTSNPVSGSAILYLEPTAGGSTIDGFTFDGNNTTITSGVVINGIDVDAAEGIGAYAGIANTTISNNILKNLNYAGIDFDNFYTNSIATTGNLITNNRFTNIFPAQYGAGVAIADNCYTSIINNKMDSVRLGIQTSKFFQADPGNSHTISNNLITSSRTGIWYYFMYANATAFSLVNNTLNTYTGAANNNGILIDSVLDATGVILTGNIVNGAYAGINLYNNPTTNTIAVGVNTLAGCSYGIFANNYDGFNTNAGAPSTYYVKGTTIQNASVAGIYVKDNGTSSHQSVGVLISDSTVISNSTTGLRIEGSAASVNFNGTKPAVFKGQSVYIDQVSNGTSLPATAINATNVVFDSITGSAATLAQNFKIEDQIRHKIDSAGLGFVLVKANNAFVTLNSHIAANTTASVQRAIDAIASGYIVNVDSGNYKEDIVINKKSSVLGTGYLKTTISGSKGGSNATIQVASPGVLLDGLKITREGNNPTDWNNATLNTNGIYIQGQTNDAEIRNCWLYGNYNGINISNSNSNYIHNNLVENNWNGFLFSNQTDSTLVLQNFIRSNYDHGLVFADSSNGTNTPVQTSLNSIFNSNSIYNNWYGDVLDRQTGGSLPAVGTNLKNFECNWYGLASQPVLSTGSVTEPNYATQIPAAFGGTATAPVNHPANIIGTASANIDNTPWLINGTDTAVSIPGFQGVSNSCKGLLSITPLTAAAQLCATTGSVRFSFSGGKAPYNLSYAGASSGTATNIASTDTITNLVAGTYTITVTDSNGYVGIDTIVVNYYPVTNTNNKNSYATIQAAINAAASGDTLQVCGGSYKEELVINKKLTLLGPNAFVTGCSTRTAEAILYPAYVDYGYTGSHYSILRITADSVTIKGFTFNGDNPDSTNGLTVNGATIEAAEGVTVLTAQKKIGIENNIFKNIAGAAVALQPATDTILSTGNTILNNRFSNIDNTTTNRYGTGIRMGNNAYARVENNCMDSVGVGIRSANFYLADTTSAATAIANNNIASRVVGVWLTNIYQNAPAPSVQRNTLKSTANNLKNTSLLLSGVRNNAGASFQLNTISNSQYGIRLYNNAGSGLIKITGGTFNNCDTAIFTSNYDSTNTAVASSYIIDSVTITGGNTGLVVKDDKNAAIGGISTVTVQGNTRITNTITGIQVIGSRAGINFSGTTPASFTGQAKYIDLTSNGMTVPAGLVNATAVQFDNIIGATATPAQNFTIEDKINHKIDSATLGFVLVKAKNNFVTINSHLSPVTVAKVQRGVLAADTGFTVNIASGTFIDNVIVNKRLIIQGAGRDSTKINSVTANGNIITIAADSIAVNDLFVEGAPDSTTNLSATRGIYFNSGTKKTTLTNVKASLHQYCVLVDNLATASDIAITGAAFSNSGNGFGINVSGKVSNLTINNTAFTGNGYGLTSNADTAMGANNLNGLIGVSVTNSTFTGNTTKGAYFEKLSNAVFSNNTFTNNGSVATGAGLEVNLKYGAYSNILINGNILNNNGYAPGNGPAIAVKARNDAPNYSAIPASLNNITIANNEVTTAPVAISVGYNVNRQTARIDSNKIVATNGIISYSAAAGSVTQIHNNSIIAAQYAVINGDTASGYATLNATCNWLNSTNPTIVISKMNGPATYIPYSSSGTDNQLTTTGFQPAIACAACTTLTSTKVKTNNTCNSGAAGVITATASGGISPYLYTINPAPITMAQPIAGKFTGLPAGIYTVTGYGANGCSTAFRADTISQPIATVPDASVSIPNYTDNLFLTSGSTITFLVQVTENAGNPITSALLNLTKQDGYTLGFNPTQQSLTIRGLTYPLDNAHWTLDNSNPVFSKLAFTTPNQVPCLRSVYLAFTLTRTDYNKVNFVLTSFLNNINGETIRNNNSTTFYLVGQ